MVLCWELIENGYEFAYLSGMHLLYFYIWKNFYFATKKNIKINIKFCFGWYMYLWD